MAKPDIRNPIHLIAAGFGSGLAPRAPGTFGTLAALIPWWPLHFLPPLYYWLVVAIAFVAGIYCCGRTARDMGVHDHGTIVWDEFIGVWIALAWLPTSGAWIIAGFILFRLLDIWKPWSISWLDRHVQGGLGIIIDDVLAGFFTLAILQIARALI